MTQWVSKWLSSLLERLVTLKSIRFGFVKKWYQKKKQLDSVLFRFWVLSHTAVCTVHTVHTVHTVFTVFSVYTAHTGPTNHTAYTAHTTHLWILKYVIPGIHEIYIILSKIIVKYLTVLLCEIFKVIDI